ncbi:MAG: hypothetical protein E3J66_03875 [Dehalococcoidia bacterium]|nr:MAG: hypothetical protein E3J66_03875 [Dehalococcoidia bacterium]
MRKWKIKTQEYCEKCPWFDHALGYLEPSNPYWQQNDVRCACEDCPSREECETNGPKNIVACLADAIIRERKLQNSEAKQVREKIGTILWTKYRSNP